MGEGVYTGRAAVVCRFARPGAGSALGPRPSTRTKNTDHRLFATAHEFADAVDAAWTPSSGPRLVLCTGMEPLLQLDNAGLDALHRRGFEVAMETRGTQQPPLGIDWTCVCPRAGADLTLVHGDELRLLYPQRGANPGRYEHLDFRHFLLQPVDGPASRRNTAQAVRYCLDHPQWRLSIPAHQLLAAR